VAHPAGSAAAGPASGRGSRPASSGRTRRHPRQARAGGPSRAAPAPRPGEPALGRRRRQTCTRSGRPGRPQCAITGSR
jgi:hypothetical protein